MYFCADSYRQSIRRDESFVKFEQAQSKHIVNTLLEQRHALCIGNARYGSTSHGLGSLKAAVTDATKMARTFRDLQFTCSEIHDCTSGALREKISVFVSSLPRAARVIVLYFAGHGIEHDEQHMMLGLDALKEDPSRGAIAVDDVFNELLNANIAEDATIVFFLDCCRQHSLPKLNRRANPKLSFGRKVHPRRALNVMWACASGDGVLDQMSKDIESSPFSVVLRTLVKEGHPQTISTLVSNTKRAFEGIRREMSNNGSLSVHFKPLVELWQQCGSEVPDDSVLLFASASCVIEWRWLKQEIERLAKEEQSLFLSISEGKSVQPRIQANEIDAKKRREALDRQVSELKEVSDTRTGDELDILLSTHEVHSLMSAPGTLSEILSSRKDALFKRRELDRKALEATAVSFVNGCVQRVLLKWLKEKSQELQTVQQQHKSFNQNMDKMRSTGQLTTSLAASTFTSSEEGLSLVLGMLVAMLSACDDNAASNGSTRRSIRTVLERHPHAKQFDIGREAARAVDEGVRRDVQCERIKPPCGGYWTEYYESGYDTMCVGATYPSIRCSTHVTSTSAGFRCSRGGHTICHSCADRELNPHEVRDTTCIFS